VKTDGGGFLIEIESSRGETEKNQRFGGSSNRVEVQGAFVKFSLKKSS
jgi:hypothetical protein